MMAVLVLTMFLGIFHVTFGSDVTNRCFPNHPGEISGSINFASGQSNSFCNTLISTIKGNQISMHFVADLKVIDDVYYDYVVLFDGTDCMARRFEVVKGKCDQMITSPGKNVRLLFISDMTYPKTGFHLDYNSVPEQNNMNRAEVAVNPTVNILYNCGAELNATMPNTISWQGFDRKNTLCIWRIRNNQDKNISLRIEELQFTTKSSFVRIVDGFDCNAEIIHEFRGTKPQQSVTVHSSRSSMMIILSVPQAKSDVFKASYSLMETKTTDGGMGTKTTASGMGTKTTASGMKTKTTDGGTHQLPASMGVLMFFALLLAY